MYQCTGKKVKICSSYSPIIHFVHCKLNYKLSQHQQVS